jgi:hypothetical protein
MLALPSGWKLNSTVCAMTFLLIVSASRPARAGTILDLSIGSGGVVAYGQGEHHPRLWGSGIKVSDLTYGANILPILRGQLSFSGGTFAGSNGNSWLWGPGGSLSVTGCVDLNRDHKCGQGDFKGKLLTGTFLNAEVIKQNGKEILEAQIVDQINPQLAALLHLRSATYRGELELVLGTLRHGRWWTHDAVQGGLLKDFGNVPEPSSIWLLGACLLCLGVRRFGQFLL